MKRDVPWRVLQLASTSDMGGTERMILFLVEHLDRTEFQPYVGALIGGSELLRRAESVGCRVQHFRFRTPFDPVGFARLVRFIRDHRIDLVQTYGLRADTVGRVAARLGGARAVISSIRSIDPWRRRWHVWLDRMTAPFVDAFISNSEAGKRATVEREGFRPEKIYVIYSGVPKREIPRSRGPELKAQFGISQDAFPVVGILANLREMKGHRDVIAALPAILARLPDTTFLFAGRDDSHGEIERLAHERGVAHAIRFLGYVTDTPALLAIMDIFMLPSHWEGLPAAIVEAMHAGLPIITTAVGGIPELVRHDREAWIVPPADPQALAGAVLRLTQDRQLAQRLGAAAAKRASREFTVEAMVKRTSAIYQELLHLRAPQGPRATNG